jgi:hypothetical protein
MQPQDAVNRAIHFIFSDIIRPAIRSKRFKKGKFIRYTGIFRCPDGNFAKHILEVFLASREFNSRGKLVFKSCLLAMEENQFDSSLVANLKRIFRVPLKRSPFLGRKPVRDFDEAIKTHEVRTYHSCLPKPTRSNPQMPIIELSRLELSDDERYPVEQVITDEVRDFSMNDYPPIVPIAVVFAPEVDYSTISWDRPESGNQPDSANLVTPPEEEQPATTDLHTPEEEQPATTNLPTPDDEQSVSTNFPTPPEEEQSTSTTHNTETQDNIPLSVGQVSINESARNSPEPGDRDAETAEEEHSQLTGTRQGGRSEHGSSDDGNFSRNTSRDRSLDNANQSTQTPIESGRAGD